MSTNASICEFHAIDFAIKCACQMGRVDSAAICSDHRTGSLKSRANAEPVILIDAVRAWPSPEPFSGAYKNYIPCHLPGRRACAVGVSINFFVITVTRADCSAIGYAECATVAWDSWGTASGDWSARSRTCARRNKMRVLRKVSPHGSLPS